MRRLPAWFTVPLLAFLLSRLLIFAVGMVGDAMLATEEGHWVAAPGSPFLSLWAKWDSQYYVDIAKDGYWFRPGRQSNVAFFPVYPLLMRLAAPLVGGDLILAGFLISNLAFLAALVFFYRLTEMELDAASAKRAVLYLAIFPASFFFNCLYTESTFLFFSLATMYFARKSRWAPAALSGILASATRNMGVLLWALVMWQWLRAQGWTLNQIHRKESWQSLGRGLRQHWFDLLVIALIPLGLVIYMLFLQQNFARPLAFFETQAAWGRENVGPLAVVGDSLHTLARGEINKSWLNLFWNTSTLLLFLALVPAIWRRLGEGYAIFVLVMLLVPAASSTISMIRFASTLFPAFMLLGWWGQKEWFDRALIVTFSILTGVFVAVFVNWVFIA